MAGYLSDSGLNKKGVAVGYDHRFHSENFARAAAEVLAGAGLKVLLSDRALSSPALSYAVKNLGLDSGVMITASHNPPEWNGFKIKENFGGSAFPETTKKIEQHLSDRLTVTPNKKVELFNPLPAYLEHLRSFVDLELINQAGLKIVIDPMYGSGAGYFAALGLEVDEIRGFRNTLFGGINPEPLPVNLTETFSYVKEAALQSRQPLTACIVLDGDADRLAAVDASGRFINTHNVFALLLRHLYFNKKRQGEVVKTFNLTRLIEHFCAKQKLALTETPIGFKYIAKLMLEKEVMLGGEESGGMGIGGNIPERDGVLAGLLLLELMAKEQKSLEVLLKEIMEEYGHFYYDRIDLHHPQALQIVARLTKEPPKKFAGRPITKIETLDGLKYNFEDESWILFRASGTEPLLRVYAEGRSLDGVRQIIGAGEETAKGG
jgi:phosphomannomutase